MLPSQVSQETNKKGDHWFMSEAIEKTQQITWEDGGGFTTSDDKMLQEIIMDNFGVDNVEDTEDVSMDNGDATSVLTKSLQADEGSFHSCRTESGKPKKSDDESTDGSGKRQGVGQAVTR